MEALFLKILNMSITGSYVILALLLVRLLLKKAPKKYSYALWSVALFRLICPFSFSAAFSLFQTKLFDMPQSGAAISYVPENIAAADIPAISTGIPAVNAVLSDTLPAATETASVNPMEILIFIGAALWLTGIAALIVYNIVSFVRLKRRLMTAVRLEGNVFESDNIRSPFILGFLRPKIYIPFGLSELERDYILRHERFHLRRKDHLIKLLGLAVLVLHWFNPLVWLAFSLMQKDMEMSCDEKVLSETNGIAADYGTSLLSFAANRRFLTASPLAFGENAIRGRVKNILRFRKPRRWIAAVAALLCVAVAAACAANPAKDEANTDGNYKLTVTVNGETVSASADFQKVFVWNMPSSSLKEFTVSSKFDSHSGEASWSYENGSRFHIGENSLEFTVAAPDSTEWKYILIVGKYDDNGITANEIYKKSVSQSGADTTYIDTVLIPESIKADVMVYTAKSYYTDRTEQHTFRLKKQNGAWLVDDFTSPTRAAESGSPPTDAAITVDELCKTYAFHKEIYMNAQSAAVTPYDYQIWFTVSKDALVITDKNGNREEYSWKLKKMPLDIDAFNGLFASDGGDIPDISSFDNCFLLTSDFSPYNGVTDFQLYLMDDKLWLATLIKDYEYNDNIHTIYQLTSYDGKLPERSARTVVSADRTRLPMSDDGVKDFIALQKTESSYSEDYEDLECYNVTPDYIRQNSDYRIFAYDIYIYSSYVLYEGKTYPLNCGLTSLTLFDSNNDGKQELYFTVSIGSGIPVASAGFFDPVSKKTNYFRYEVQMNELLFSTTGNKLSLYAVAMDFYNNGGYHAADVVYTGGKTVLSPFPSITWYDFS